MKRTYPKETPMTDATKEANELDTPLWGAAAIAPVVKRTKRATFHLLQAGRLPATKVGTCWVSTRRRLLSALGVEVS
jgi:hypothetical protein